MGSNTQHTIEDKSDKRLNWHSVQIRFIQENYGKMNCIEMARYINKKPASIRWKLRKLGYKRLGLWAYQEIQFLKENKLNFSFEEMALQLNRSPRAISQKCIKLRLVRPKYHLELPLTESLAYILGCLCGDASFCDNNTRLCAKDKDFTDEFYKHCVTILKSHFIKPIYFESKGVYYVQVCSLAFKNFIVGKFGKFGTYNWVVPLEIINLNDNNLIRYFLRGFFDSEGSIKHYQVRACVVCPSLNQIHILLNKLNIKNKLYILNRKTKAGNTVYEISITGWKNLCSFEKLIGFSIQRKRIVLANYTKINSKRSKTLNLETNKEHIADLFKQGYGLHKISKLYNLTSITAVRKYIMRVLGSEYKNYALAHINRHRGLD